MAPRIAPADPAPPEALESLAASPQLGGRPLNIFGTLAHHPLLLLVGFYRMTAGFLNSTGVEVEDAQGR